MKEVHCASLYAPYGFVAADCVSERVSMSELGDRLEGLHRLGLLIEIEFPIKPEVRFGWDKPPHPQLHAMISRDDARYAETLRGFCRYAEQLHRIPFTSDDPATPTWLNLAIPVADAVSIYGYLADRNPARYVEIGSGNSTKFARRAIQDHGLRTKIISIDPAPRAEVDAICDEVIREPLEKADLSIFDTLTSDDMVFCDNSHRSFQNSDVTTFFLDVMPRTRGGPLIGIHDIFLPHDYQQGWLNRFYNEQYLLACWLLGGAAVEIELALFHVTMTPELRACLDPIWQGAEFDKAVRKGGAFWFRH